MRKITCLVVLFTAILTYSQTTTVNFDEDANWIPSSGGSINSYQDGHSYVDGVFSAMANSALRQGNTNHDGFPTALGTFSWRLRNNNMTSWTATIASGGVEDFSVAVRRWDGDPSPNLNLEYSVDGGTSWEFVALINNASLNEASNWVTFSGSVQSDADDILIRISPNSTGERIMIDDFEWTGFSAPDETGEDCSNAFVVNQIPYTDSGATGDYGNNYTSSDRPDLGGEQVAIGTGSASYLNGPDVVYSFTPTQDGVFNFDLSASVSGWISFWLFEGCEPFTSIVARHTSNTGNTRSLPEINLTAGQTYYVVISGWSVGTGPATYDYTLNISKIACANPTDLALDMMGINSADFSWTAVGDETGGYEYVVMPEGLNPIDDFADNVANGTTASGETSTSVSGLSADTTYAFFLRAVCDTSDLSDYIATGFTTSCAAFIAPYFEDFNTDPTTIPDCWSQGLTNSEDWLFSDTPTGHIGNNGSFPNSSPSGGGFAWVDDSSPHSSNTRLVSPFIDISDLTIPALSFYFISDNEGDTNVDFSVEVWNGTAWNEVFFSNQNSSGAAWEQVIINLSNLTITGDIQIAFIVDENNGTDFYDDLAIDDVSVDEAPNCFAPSSVMTSNITGIGLDFSWEETATAINGYEWVITEETGDISDNTTWIDSGLTDAGTTQANSSALLPETAYVLNVRTDCDTEGLSEWTMSSFTTTILCPTPSNLTLNGVTESSADFSWTAAIAETNGYEYAVMPEGLNPVDHFADNVANGTTNPGETSLSIFGLSDQTNYEFFLSALCDSSETSEYIALSFTTDCLPATLNYSEDFTGFTENLNTGSATTCWSEGTGFFDSVTNGQWGTLNFNNDDANPNGTALHINLFSSTQREDWITSQPIDLGEGSPEYILTFDAYVSPWSINETNPEPVTDFGAHSVQIVISNDGGITWDLANSVMTYDDSNIPNNLEDTQEIISLADYSGVIQIGVHSIQNGTTPDLRFFIDNMYVGTPPTCEAPIGLDISNLTTNSAELSWDAVINPATQDAYNWYVFLEGDDPTIDTPVASGTTDDTVVLLTGLLADTNYQAYVEADCGTDGNSPLSDGVSFYTGYCVPVANNNFSADYISLFETTNALSNVSIAASALPSEAYRNLASIESITAYAGQSISFNSTYADTNGSTQMKLWADWNQNVQFDEPSEVLFQQHSSNNAKSGTFTVPETIENGTYRVRVRAQWTATNTNGPTPCGAIAYGDAIDLAIEVIDQPDSVIANVQLIHNSPDPTTASVDVYLDGVLFPELSGVNFREASEFLAAPANEDFVIDIVPVGGDISERVFTETLNLEEDNYVIVVNGVLDPSSFENASAFELAIYQGARLVAEEANDVDILVHHGSPDAPAVDVNEPNAGNWVSNIAYPEFQGYLSVPEADYVLEIAPAGDPTPLAIFSAPLAALGGFEGEAITIVASGFFGEDAGMDNGFGLWVATAAGGPLLELSEINTSTLDFDGDNFTYYPNPVETTITIQAKNIVEQVEVFNMLGQRVLVQRPNQTNPSLNMSNMESGVYLMKVSIHGANKSFQIIKE